MTFLNSNGLCALPTVLLDMIARFLVSKPVKFERFIDDKNIDWNELCENSSGRALYVWEQNLINVNWGILSQNRSAIKLFEKHPDKIQWINFSRYPEVIDILERNLDLIKDWRCLSANPAAVHLFEQNLDRIDWAEICSNTCVDAINFFLKHFKSQERRKIITYHVNRDYLSGNPAAFEFLEKNPWAIKWRILCESEDPRAISILEKNLDKIQWDYLSANPAAIRILEQNIDKIYWLSLSTNNKAMHILEKHMDKINWDYLCSNTSAIDLLEKNVDKINWNRLCKNPAAGKLFKKYPTKLRRSIFSNPCIFIDDEEQYKIDLNLWVQKIKLLKD